MRDQQKLGRKIWKSLLLTAMVLIMTIGLCGCESEPQSFDHLVFEGIPDELKAVKIGMTEHTGVSLTEGGFYYQDKETGLYGVVSHNGKYDSGAIYVHCVPRGIYFEVGFKTAESYSDIAGLNSFGLVDAKGNQIIPFMYASFNALSDNFVKATKVTERTYNEDEAVLYYTDDTISVTADDDDILFAGEWCVYDANAAEVVPSVSGTTSDSAVVYGNFIRFRDAEGNFIEVDNKGNLLTCERLFENGTYSLEERVGTVYGEGGEPLFDYDLTSYIPSSSVGEYYLASKYMDGGSKYVLLDKTGAVVTAEFDSSFDVYGNMIHCDEGVYNFEGKKIITGEYDSVSYDQFFENCWMLRTDDVYTMINADGDILYKGEYKKNNTIYASEFVASTKKDDEYYFFSHKDKDYTIKGYSFAPWLVKTNNANYTYDVVDTISGNTIFEGYEGYTYHRVEKKALYVYARYNGGTDIYQILSGKQLDTTEQKKTNLLDELIAAFQASGINVTVNQETGEMALEASVLFGGDSSVLTADGQAFLNKFITAYTSIVFKDEYRDFISKTFIEGHIAPVQGSTYESGLQLSVERAENVKNYCFSAQTALDATKFAEEFEAVGYSNTKPVYDANGEVDMAASRRVTFRFMINA